MATDTAKSHLLGCASEIRNVIYSYALTYDNPIMRGKPDEITSISLALLQVSKLVEQEAAPIFYERNLFRFGSKHCDIPIENNLDVLNQVRAKEGLSSYDDSQTTCPMIDVPKRHINSLRKVNLIRELPGHWPNGPLFDNRLGRQGLGILDLENAITYLAERNVILNLLSITLKRIDLCSSIQWDPDPSTLLRELDAESRISTAVGKLANLDRLEIWKLRVTRDWPESLRVPREWTAVQPEALDRVKLDHFPKAQVVLYTRRAEKGDPGRSQIVYCIAEEFLIDFEQPGVNCRKLEYPSEIERLPCKTGWR